MAWFSEIGRVFAKVRNSLSLDSFRKSFGVIKMETYNFIYFLVWRGRCWIHRIWVSLGHYEAEGSSFVEEIWTRMLQMHSYTRILIQIQIRFLILEYRGITRPRWVLVITKKGEERANVIIKGTLHSLVLSLDSEYLHIMNNTDNGTSYRLQ